MKRTSHQRPGMAASAALQMRHKNTTTANQLASLSHLHRSRNQLTNADGCNRLHELGFLYTDKVPTTGAGRIPSRGKGDNNTVTAVCRTGDGQALHWYEFTTEDHGTIFADKQQVYDKAEADKQALRL